MRLGPDGDLLEREAELLTLRDVLARAGEGAGGVALVEGVAGLGKTALLRAALAELDDGRLVLRATASDLDRRYPYGLVHQLLDAVVADPGRRGRLLTGAAAQAAPVLLGGDAPAEAYAVLHGLYWAIANLAEEAPVVLAVDDLHWADGPSLRLLEYLGRRLDGLPVAVVATTRPNEPGADHDVLAALADGPAAVRVALAPLSDAAAGGLVAAELGREPDAAFVQACAGATRGNPLLLRSLLREAAAGGLTGAAADAGRARTLGAAGLAASVARRLHALGDVPTQVGEAVAVLGDLRPAGGRQALQDVTALAPSALAQALEALVAAGLLRDDGLEFVHPLVRDAVAGGVPAARRGLMHAAAARRLAAAGARPGEVATHLLVADPAGDPAVVEQLREAARAASAEPSEAAVYLRRALDEPPGADERPGLLVELGEAQARAGDPAAEATLAEALAVTGDPDVRARITGAHGTILVHSDPGAALDELEGAVADARDPDLRLRLEALALELSSFHVAFAGRREELLTAGRADPAPSAAMLAHLAIEGCWLGVPAEETVELGDRALADDRLVEVVGAASSTWNLLVHTYRYAERPERARRLLEAGAASSARRGAGLAAFFVDHAWAYWHQAFGSVAAGLGHAETGMRQVTELGFEVTVPAFAAIVAELLVEDDRAQEADALLAPYGPGAVDATVSGPFITSARGRTQQALGRLDAAEEELRRAVGVLDTRGWAGHVTRGRLRLAQVLAERGAREEALAVADGEVELARRLGAEGAMGVALRVRGLALGGDDGIAVLEDAARRLARGPLRLDLGWTQHALGALHRRAGRRTVAREHLREALGHAEATGGRLLGRLVREELAAAGGRAPRASTTGVGALTPAERRVADLAADGLANRAIAETLWVTRKTVEVHLTRVYDKLGIRSRQHLADALGREAA